MFARIAISTIGCIVKVKMSSNGTLVATTLTVTLIFLVIVVVPEQNVATEGTIVSNPFTALLIRSE